MKTILTQLQTVFLLAASIFIVSCASSSVITKPIHVPPQVSSSITVAPIAAPSKSLVGVKSTTIVSGGIAGSPIVVGFTWDQQDCENLRQSIQSSLQAGGTGSGGAGTSAGYVIHVLLTEAGITRMDLPTCRVAGSLTLTKSGRTVSTKALNISATVLTAVSAAKDKAIRELIANVESLLQSA